MYQYFSLRHTRALHLDIKQSIFTVDWLSLYFGASLKPATVGPSSTCFFYEGDQPIPALSQYTPCILYCTSCLFSSLAVAIAGYPFFFCHLVVFFIQEKAPSLHLMAVIFLCGIIMVKGLKLEEASTDADDGKGACLVYCVSCAHCINKESISISSNQNHFNGIAMPYFGLVK